MNGGEIDLGSLTPPFRLFTSFSKTEIHHYYSMPLAKPEQTTLLTLLTDPAPARKDTGRLPHFLYLLFLSKSIYYIRHPSYPPSKKDT